MKFRFLILMSVFICCVGKPKLSDFAYKFCSNEGEDGIIQKIFEVIGTRSKVCIEFGAVNGFHQANTALLWMACGWKAILIEGDNAQFEFLQHNVKYFNNCIPIHTFVGFNEGDCLEAILKKNGINEQIDLLSIDIDGNDYYIFDSLKELRPRVIICEYNPSMPATIDIYPNKNNELGQFGLGCSVAALIRVAESKGYKLIALTDFNCFFVAKEEFDKFMDFETSLANLRIDKHLKYVITDYTGRYMVIGEEKDYYLSEIVTVPLGKDRVLGEFYSLDSKFQK